MKRNFKFYAYLLALGLGITGSMFTLEPVEHASGDPSGHETERTVKDAKEKVVKAKADQEKINDILKKINSKSGNKQVTQAKREIATITGESVADIKLTSGPDLVKQMNEIKSTANKETVNAQDEAAASEKATNDASDEFNEQFNQKDSGTGSFTTDDNSATNESFSFMDTDVNSNKSFSDIQKNLVTTVKESLSDLPEATDFIEEIKKATTQEELQDALTTLEDARKAHEEALILADSTVTTIQDTRKDGFDIVTKSEISDLQVKAKALKTANLSTTAGKSLWDNFIDLLSSLFAKLTGPKARHLTPETANNIEMLEKRFENLQERMTK